GFASFRGLEALRAAMRIMEDLADDLTVHIEEIFALEPDRFLLRSTLSGSDRHGGGRFETPFLQLRVFDPRGMLARTAWFDVGSEPEALARFDALTNEAAVRAARRVRPNAATRNDALLDAAVNARDEAALADLFAEHTEAVRHPTGITYDRAATLARFGPALR